MLRLPDRKMKKVKAKTAMLVPVLTVILAGNTVFAAGPRGTMPGAGQPGIPTGGMAGYTLADSPSEIVISDTVNTAQQLVRDDTNAIEIEMSDDNSQVKIEDSGTYIITGTCSDGNITVKKGAAGIVLILRDLDLTSTKGAPLSCNKTSEVKIIIEGTVSLTDAENPDDEDSADAETADAFDGACLKAKDGSNVYLTGTGTLILNAQCKNGLKVGDEGTPSFVIDGDLTIKINAANDGINAGYDLTILSGSIEITAGDDAIHADRILTIGNDGTGPDITVTQCCEGLEGTIVDLFGGTATITSSDDGINAANSDGTYESELTYSINITGGTWIINAGGDGLDSNGNVNITGGSVTIKSATAGGEAGIDFDGVCYIADGTVKNTSGITGPDGGGQMPVGQNEDNTSGIAGPDGGGQVPVGQNEDNTSEIADPDDGEQMPVGQNEATALFTDVSDASSYYYDAVYWAADNGITLGTGDSKFSPGQTCTRAQIITFLWRYMGEPEPIAQETGFKDVPEDSYYAKAVAWAVENGITNGLTDTTFGPGEECTRAQTVAFLWRSFECPSSGNAVHFSDVAEDSYYAEAVAWAAANGITAGTSEKTFSPFDACTRGQVVTFLYRAARQLQQ